MESRENRGQKVAQVARQIGAELRKQARMSWKGVVTAERNEGDRHVWRFRSPADGSERFLHLPHRAMVKGGAASVLQQLEAGRWTDRLSSGSGNAIILAEGELQAYPVN